MSFKFVDLQQNTPEWEQFRKGKIGASHAPSIMGVGFKTPLQLWEELVFDIKTPENDAMRRGKEMEPVARECVNKYLGATFSPAVAQSLDHPWFIASLDGYGHRFSDDKIHALEIKCPQKRYALGVVPETYIPQVQHQMRLLGIPMMFFVNFYGEDDFDVVEVEYDEKYSDRVFSLEMAFKSNLDDFVPPEATDRDWVQINDSGLLETADKLISTKAMIKQLEIAEEKLKSELKSSLTNPRSKLGALKAQRYPVKGNIDYKKIEVLQGMDLEPYRKPRYEKWDFRV